MRRLNVKLVAIVSTVSVLSVVLVAVVHYLQMKRTANVLLSESQAAETSGDTEQAVMSLSQYVEYRPEDTDQAAHLALLLADIGERPDATSRQIRRAFDTLEKTLRTDPGRDEVRRRLADYAIRVGRFSDATDHLLTLLNKDANDADLRMKLGQCQLVLDQKNEAKDSLEKAIFLDPQRETAYAMLAVLLHDKFDRREEADKIIDSMIAANPESPKAWLTHAQYALRYQAKDRASGREAAERAKQDLAKALELDPDNADALVAAAQFAGEEKNIDEMRKYLEHGIAVHPDDPRLVELLTRVYANEKNYEKANQLIGKHSKGMQLHLVDLQLRLQQNDIEGAKKLLQEVKENPDSPPIEVEYMQAYVDFAEGKWLEASKKFEELLPVLPVYAPQITMALARCYEMLGETDRQLEAFRQAVRADPEGVAARLGLALSLRNTGDVEGALRELLNIKEGMGTDSFVRIAPARVALLDLMMQRMNRLPAAERKWNEIEDIIAATRHAEPNAADLPILEAAVREQKGDVGAACEILAAAVKKSPKEVPVWISLARTTFVKDGASAAFKVIDQAEQEVGSDPRLRQMRVSLAVQLPKAEVEQVLSAEAADAEKLTGDDQVKQWRTLGVAFFRVGDIENARKYWQKVAAAQPTDPAARFTMLDIAIHSGDDAEIDNAVKGVKELFGEGTPEAKYAEARQLVSKVRGNRSGDPKKALDSALKLVQRAAESRPAWSALARLEGDIELLSGHQDAALDALQRAIDRLGDTDPATARQVAQLLIVRGRADEAQRYLNMTTAAGKSQSEAVDPLLQVGIAMAQRDVPKALSLLEQAHRDDPDNVAKTIPLGQLLAQMGKREEAEALFREAVSKQPTNTFALLELVKFLAASPEKRTDDARRVIEEARANLPKEQADAFAGPCFEMIHDLSNAEACFLRARDDNPNDIGMQRALASYYLRTRNEEKSTAELERLMKEKATTDSERETVAWANRELALKQAASKDYGDFRKAMDRLKPAKGQPIALADKIVMARLLSERPDASSRIQATQMLEEIKRETALPGDGQLLLAELYELTGNWPKARQEMLTLLGNVKDNPLYVKVFVGMLLRNNDTDSAASWLSTLKQLSPNDPTTVALEARILVKQGKAEEAVAMLKSLIPDPLPPENIRMLVEVASVLEEIGQIDAAEELFRQYVARDRDGMLILARFIGRTRSLTDALDICQQALDGNRVPLPIVIRDALAILRMHQSDATPADYSRVEGWISGAIAKHPKELIFQLNMTELLEQQARYAELEDVYKKLLTQSDVKGNERAFLLNNLAYLLAVQDKGEEAKKYIDEAITICGPLSDLCDTRALIHMAHGEVRDALKDMNLSIIDGPNGLKYFHLAQAQYMANNAPAAREALKKAIDDFKIKLDDLPPHERGAFKQLSEALGVPVDSAQRSSTEHDATVTK